ncbi:MAG TPA: biotin/lipoyl-containing protein [Gammaproteobacteria bacterium]|nr:biotin/lipoyl-containing protein [Gammaproteobacteria bacterium]
MPLTHADVEEILRLLEHSPYDELHLDTGKFRLTLRRGAEGTGQWSRETQTLNEPHRIETETGGSAPILDVDAETATFSDHEPDTVPILAPMIGTFYRAPKPGAPPFVEVGSRVGKDTIIAIIEVMKLMNSVPAGKTGTITAILAEDGEFIEAGQVLMRLRPDPA